LVLTLALPWRDIKCDPMKSWDFLHVSDLHLSATSQYIDDLKVHVDPAFRDNAFAAFVSLYKNSELLKSVRYVIFSGDVTTAGEQDGFDQFSREVVPNLRGSSEKHFFIVPGNHDVVWSLDPKMSDYLSKKFSSFRDISHETDMTAALLPTGGLMGGRLEFEPRSPVWINKEEDLLVLCINSAIRCGEVNDKLRDELHSRLDSVHAQLKSSKDFASAGSIEQALHEIDKFTLRDVAHVTRAQLAALEYELNRARSQFKADWNALLRVAVLHHHLTPFRYQVPEHKAFEPISDAAAVLQFLDDCGFHLVFTGHKHRAYEVRFNGTHRDILILGGRTVCGYGDRGCRLIRIAKDQQDFLVNIADLDTDRLSFNSNEFVTSALEIAKKSAQRVSVAPISGPRGSAKLGSSNLSAERDNLQKCFRHLQSTEFLIRDWQMTYSVDQFGGDDLLEELTIVPEKAVVSVYFQRIGATQSFRELRATISAFDASDLCELPMCEIDRDDTSILYAIILDPPATPDFPKRIEIKCRREELWTDLLNTRTDMGVFDARREVQGFLLRFIAPQGRQWKTLRRHPMIGDVSLASGCSQIEWRIANLKAQRLSYTLFLR